LNTFVGWSSGSTPVGSGDQANAPPEAIVGPSTVFSTASPSRISSWPRTLSLSGSDAMAENVGVEVFSAVGAVGVPHGFGGTVVKFSGGRGAMLNSTTRRAVAGRNFFHWLLSLSLGARKPNVSVPVPLVAVVCTNVFSAAEENSIGWSGWVVPQPPASLAWPDRVSSLASQCAVVLFQVTGLAGSIALVCQKSTGVSPQPPEWSSVTANQVFSTRPPANGAVLTWNSDR
jgi:hypothetical protein